MLRRPKVQMSSKRNKAKSCWIDLLSAAKQDGPSATCSENPSIVEFQKQNIYQGRFIPPVLCFLWSLPQYLLLVIVKISCKAEGSLMWSSLVIFLLIVSRIWFRYCCTFRCRHRQGWTAMQSNCKLQRPQNKPALSAVSQTPAQSYPGTIMFCP